MALVPWETTATTATANRAAVLLDRVNESYLKLRFNRQHDRPESEFFYPRTDAGPHVTEYVCGE